MHPAVIGKIRETLEVYGNPSSLHRLGREADSLVQIARESVARLVNARADEIVFTGGGTESNNSVIKACPGHECAPRETGSGRIDVCTTAIEHPSVMNAVRWLSSRGRACRFLPVDGEGYVDIDALDAALREGCSLVSIMAANNEIGTIQDIPDISRRIRAHGALFHSDAVQALGKIQVDVRAMNVDFLSLSAHKIYGPKGIGALYVRNGAPFDSFMHGGHQEGGFRAGTENTLGIIALGEAARIAEREIPTSLNKLSALKEKMKSGIMDRVPNVRFNGPAGGGLSQTLNISFPGASGESIARYLDDAGIAVSTGSACSSGFPSHVLAGIGLKGEETESSIRISFGFFNTEEEVDILLSVLPTIIERLRKKAS